MKIRKASAKEVKYACQRFHYAQATPATQYAYSVFNDDNEWCGCVIFSSGATPNIGKPYGLFMGEIVELVRVALNGKQPCTSQVVASCLKQLHKDAPKIKLIVSYADSGQGHLGTIYQATNWMFVGDTEGGDRYFLIHGKKTHRRSVGALGGVQNIEWVRKNLDPNAEEIPDTVKHKYLYFFDKRLKKQFANLSKPYPKNEGWEKPERSSYEK